MPSPMMACGHTANATSDGKPSCVICAGIRPGAMQVVESPNLDGRMARCAHHGANLRVRSKEGPCGHGVCTCEKPSAEGLKGRLAFFEHRPDKERDLYYCGCAGWD